jgi:hypothetical protein
MGSDSRDDPGALLATTHDAAGLRVRLRLARPSDALRVGAFLEGHAPDLAGQARRFTFYDPRERLVLAATAPIDGSEQIVGLADLAPLEARQVRILVDDRTPSAAVRDLLARAAVALAARVRRAA